VLWPGEPWKPHSIFVVSISMAITPMNRVSRFDFSLCDSFYLSASGPERAPRGLRCQSFNYGVRATGRCRFSSMAMLVMKAVRNVESQVNVPARPTTQRLSDLLNP
jgi:hypothetical protein